jgi:hypothetical protein
LKEKNMIKSERDRQRQTQTRKDTHRRVLAVVQGAGDRLEPGKMDGAGGGGGGGGRGGLLTFSTLISVGQERNREKEGEGGRERERDWAVNRSKNGWTAGVGRGEEELLGGGEEEVVVGGEGFSPSARKIVHIIEDLAGCCL